MIARARSLAAEGRLDEALAVLDELIRAEPDSAVAHADRGTVRAMQREHALARADLERAFGLGHDEAAAFSTAGTVCAKLRDHASALDYFDRALRRDPGYAFAFYNRARARQAMGDAARAAADLQACLGLGPNERFAKLVRARLAVEVRRAERQGVPVALRLVRFPQPPLVDPAPTIARVGAIVASLGLASVARLVEVEPTPDGVAIAEAWAGDAGYFAGPRRPLATIARDLAPILDDLVALHRAGKWHGGIRPSRFVLGPDGVRLVALPWAAFVTSLVRPLADTFEPDRAPELIAIGPAAAGPALDVHGLGVTLLQNAVPDEKRALLQAAASPDPRARPRMAELRAALLG